MYIQLHTSYILLIIFSCTFTNTYIFSCFYLYCYSHIPVTYLLHTHHTKLCPIWNISFIIMLVTHSICFTNTFTHSRNHAFKKIHTFTHSHIPTFTQSHIQTISISSAKIRFYFSYTFSLIY